MPEKMYEISEGSLIQLLEDSHALSILEQDGVDNWSWYMEGYSSYLKDHGIDTEEGSLRDLARQDLQYYKEIEN